VYVRRKVIKGHIYHYLVRGERHGKTVRQKVIQYLGKGPLRAERYDKEVRQKVLQFLGKEDQADAASVRTEMDRRELGTTDTVHGNDTVVRSATGGAEKSTSTSKELQPLAEEARKFDTAEEFVDNQNIPKFEDVAYRAETGFTPRGSAFDVVQFERDELGNKEDFAHLSENFVERLKNIQARDVVWVTKTKKVASRYGIADKVFDLGENPRIIAEDGDGGFLILKSKGVQQLTDFFNQVKEREGVVESKKRKR